VITRCTPGWTLARTWVTGRVSSNAIACSVSSAVAPANGSWKVTISYSTTPSEKMSLRWSTAWPRACSGLM
jgi:hypothetical protein